MEDNNSNRSYIKVGLFCILIIFLGSIFYGIYNAILFGKSMRNAIQNVSKVEEEWKKKGVSPIDSVINQIFNALDSSSLEEKEQGVPPQKPTD